MERGLGAKAEYIFRVPEDKWKPWAVQNTFKSGRVSIMVWAAFSGYTRSKLIFCEPDPDTRRGGVSGRNHLRLLQQQLPGLMASGTILMQDNAPIHTFREGKAWIAEQGYEAMDWPPFSPDLNPIENTWGPLKENVHMEVPQLHEITNPVTCRAALQAVLPGAWDAIPDEKFDRLIASMPRRVQAVIEADGWYTKY